MYVYLTEGGNDPLTMLLKKFLTMLLKMRS